MNSARPASEASENLFLYFAQSTQMQKREFNQAGNYMFKVNNRNTRKRCEICSKLTIKTSEGCQLLHSGVFIVNFDYISYLVLVFLLSTLSR